MAMRKGVDAGVIPAGEKMGQRPCTRLGSSSPTRQRCLYLHWLSEVSLGFDGVPTKYSQTSALPRFDGDRAVFGENIYEKRGFSTRTSSEISVLFC